MHPADDLPVPGESAALGDIIDFKTRTRLNATTKELLELPCMQTGHHNYDAGQYAQHMQGESAAALAEMKECCEQSHGEVGGAC